MPARDRREAPAGAARGSGVEVLDQPCEGHLLAGQAQGTHLVSEVALGLAQVVGLGEALGAEGLVGDLRLGAPRQRVVDVRALGRPLQEPPTARPGGVDELLAQRGVSLRVDHGRAHAAGDRGHGDPRLRDRLARAGRSHHQRVGAAGAGAERDRHPAPALVVAEEQRARPARGGVLGHRAAGTDQQPGRKRARGAAVQEACFAVDPILALGPLPATKAPPRGQRAECDRQRRGDRRARWARAVSAAVATAQLQCRRCLRISREPRSPTATASRHSPVIAVRPWSASNSWTGGVWAARRAETCEGMSPSFQVCPPPGGGDARPVGDRPD